MTLRMSRRLCESSEIVVSCVARVFFGTLVGCVENRDSFKLREIEQSLKRNTNFGSQGPLKQ